MAAGELNEETLAALAQQGGIQPEVKPSVEPVVTEEPKQEEDISLVIPDEEPTETPTEPDQEKGQEVDKLLKDNGFDVDAIAKQIAETGEIPEDVIKDAREKLGDQVVDAHLGRIKAEIALAKSKEYQEAQERKVTEMNEYIFKAVGGQEKFKVLSDTLKTTMTKAELDSINAKLISGNKLLVNEGLETAVKAYKKAKGIGGQIMQGDAGSNTPDALPHITKEDFRKIMKSEKYKSDPVYRDQMNAARLASRKADQERYAPGMYYGVGPNGRYAL